MKFGLKFGGVLVALEALLLWFAPVAIGTNEPIAVLQTRTATYTNVTITGRGGTNIYVRHSGGVSSIRIDELEPDAQKSLPPRGRRHAASRRTSTAPADRSSCSTDPIWSDPAGTKTPIWSSL